MKWRFKIIVLLFLFIAAPLLSQQISHDMVKKGIELFYMADFEESMRILQSAILNEILSEEEEFYAYLYVGFGHLRNSSDMGSAQLYFQRAIEIDPEKELNPNKIPPDLISSFQSVKASLLGAIIVASKPSDAAVMLINASTNKVKRARTPASFQNLPVNNYQVLVSKSGYETFSSSINVQAGSMDSVSVTLLEKEKSFMLKYWPYGAGALAASAVILAITTGGRDEPAPKSTPGKDLPYPPERP